ncbi:hypothetical protein DAPPUDRAFT_100140 [Daphnia pulex]|uniref:Uncharacterized protein n=1 Tax=Daphnia pulex TaxID=6669 RepID=E9G9H9_DAPPU|nr:hypothetical protein DAPPUDRAFT_100140 [Daphnia pulex]|eukprot:EFX83567.1 hypothetical protein DAPPUDRAFT_100140 [Daphnia pulex]
MLMTCLYHSAQYIVKDGIRNLLIHWDSKLVKYLTGKVDDRVAFLVSGKPELENPKLLGNPVIASSTRTPQHDAVMSLLADWEVIEKIVGLVFDTTSIRDGGTRWHLAVENSTGWYEVAGIIFRLKFPAGTRWPAEISILEGAKGERRAGCPDEVRLEERLADAVSGVIINTCGWVKGQGYQMLIHAAKAFEVDLIIVLDQERLYNELVRDLPETVKVVFQPKSGGVCFHACCGTESACKSRISRSENSRIFLRIQFYPHSFEVRFSDVKIFKIGAPALPDSLMPLGMKAEDQLTKLVTVQPSQQLLHHLISISMTESGEDDIIQTNVTGFICVNNVDLERQMLTVLSPQPRPLPRTRLLLSDIQYMDSH